MNRQFGNSFPDTAQSRRLPIFRSATNEIHLARIQIDAEEGVVLRIIAVEYLTIFHDTVPVCIRIEYI